MEISDPFQNYNCETSLNPGGTAGLKHGVKNSGTRSLLNQVKIHSFRMSCSGLTSATVGPPDVMLKMNLKGE